MKIHPYTLIYIWTGIGFVLGLIPLILGLVKKKASYGILGLVCSTVGGAILGIFLIVPVLIVFLFLILRKDPAEKLPETSENADVS
ncbi:MAG: hypothetical protein R2747_23035 [Pyrinomonadaceae bacterium]